LYLERTRQLCEQFDDKKTFWLTFAEDGHHTVADTVFGVESISFPNPIELQATIFQVYHADSSSCERRRALGRPAFPFQIDSTCSMSIDPTAQRLSAGIVD
jgi:hypothetical protein